MSHRYHPGMEPIPGYKIVDFLGEGSYGAVYKARGPGGVENALKFINLDNKQGLKEFRSVSLVKKLRHANLVPIHAIWLRDSNGNVMDETTGGESISINLMGNKELVIAMGLGDKSLADRLNETNGKGIPPDKLLRYMEDAAKGIDYLNEPTHEPNNSSIIHCDIKPGNLLIVGGSVQVCDYGVAKALLKKADLKKTMGAGTPAYAAPELINNDPSPQTDQYSLAITYVELRTGMLPFDETKALVSNLTGRLDLSRLDRAEQEVIRRATSMQTNKRYATCLEMIEDLKVATGVTINRTGTVTNSSTTRRPVSSGDSSFSPGRTLDDLLQKGEMLVPEHTLVRRLGEGGYGQVWEARGPFEKACALKIVRRAESRGTQEYEILSKITQIEHPNLMVPHEIWLLANDGSRVRHDRVGKPGHAQPAAVVIKTRLAEKNLLQRMRECQQQGLEGIAPTELILYMHQAGAAIDHLNQNNIQHRDIKPENILLLNNQAYVSDFGLAKLVDDDGNAPHSSSSGMTLDYAAPELLDERRVTLWTDQYSLALTYITLRTGHLPYPVQASPVQKIQARLQDELDLSALTPPEREVLAVALDRDPGKRFDNCEAMTLRLSAALGINMSNRGSGPLGMSGSGPQPSLGSITQTSQSSTSHSPLGASGTHPPMQSREPAMQGGSGPPTAAPPRPGRASQDDDYPYQSARQSTREAGPLPSRNNGTVKFGEDPTTPHMSFVPVPPEHPQDRWKTGSRTSQPPVSSSGSTQFREIKEPGSSSSVLVKLAAAAVIVAVGVVAVVVLDPFKTGSTAAPPADRAKLISELAALQELLKAGKTADAQERVTSIKSSNPPADLADAPENLLDAWRFLNSHPENLNDIPRFEKDSNVKLTRLPVELQPIYEVAVREKLGLAKEYIARLIAIQELVREGKTDEMTKAVADFKALKPPAILANVPTELQDAWNLLKENPNGKEEIDSLEIKAKAKLEKLPNDLQLTYKIALNQKLEDWSSKSKPDRAKFIVMLKAITKLVSEGNTTGTKIAIEEFEKLKPPTELSSAPAAIQAAWQTLEKAPGDVDDVILRFKVAMNRNEKLPDELKKDHQSALETKLAEWLGMIAPKISKVKSWGELAEVCKKAKPIPQALLEECLLEQDLPAKKLDGSDEASKYVNAVLLAKAKDYSGAADLIGHLPDFVKDSPRRASHVQDILEQAAAKSSDPKKVPVWLEKVSTLASISGRPAGKQNHKQEIENTFAAFLKSPKDPALVGIVDTLKAKVNLKTLDHTTAVRFWGLYAATRSNAKEQRTQAVTAYSEILQSAQDHFGAIPPKLIYDMAIGPLGSAEFAASIASVGTETQSAAAALMRKAAFSLRSSAEQWKSSKAFPGQPLEESIKLLNAAYQLGKSPDDLAWRGLIRLELDGKFPDADWREFSQLGNSIKKTTAILTLQGIAEGQPAKTAADFADRALACKDARTAFQSAVELGKDDREALLLALKHGADNDIMLANYSIGSSDKPDPGMRAVLLEAVSWSRRLLDETQNNPDAFDSLGCALEDLAWLMKDANRFEDSKIDGRYRAAEDAFDSAINPTGTGASFLSLDPHLRAKAYVHLGRCRFKWAEELQHAGKTADAGKKLNQSLADLKKAQDLLAPNLAYERAECFYYLGRIAAFEKDRFVGDPSARADKRSEAIAQFKSCLDQSKSLAARDWRTLAVSSLGDQYLSDVNSRRVTDPAVIKTLLEDLERLLADDPAPPPSESVRSYLRVQGLLAQARYKVQPLDEEKARDFAVAGLKNCPSQDRWTQPGLMATLGDLFADVSNRKIQDAEKAEKYYREAIESAKQIFTTPEKVAPYQGKLGLFLFTKAGKNTDAEEKLKLMVESCQYLAEADFAAPNHPEAIAWRLRQGTQLREIIHRDPPIEKDIDKNSRNIHERADMATKSIALLGQIIVDGKASSNTDLQRVASDLEKYLKGYAVVYKRCLEDGLKDKHQKANDLEAASWMAAQAELAFWIEDTSPGYEPKKLRDEALKAYKSAKLEGKDAYFLKIVKSQIERIGKQ